MSEERRLCGQAKRDENGKLGFCGKPAIKTVHGMHLCESCYQKFLDKGREKVYGRN